MNVNKIFDYDDFSSDELSQYRHLFGGLSRKSWENLILMYGFDKLGCLEGDKVALGLGCLIEPLIFVYANFCKHVYVTDRAYSPGIMWGKQNYTPEQVYTFNKIPYDKSKLTVLPMDMKQLDFDDSMFDFVWSSSSVEHVGMLEDVLRCFGEIERVLKPGGVCGMTVEWNLEPTDKILKFGNILCFDTNVLDAISKKCPTLKLIEPVVTARSDNPKNREPAFLRGKTNFPNVHKWVDFTSASIFWRKVTNPSLDPYREWYS